MPDHVAMAADRLEEARTCLRQALVGGPGPHGSAAAAARLAEIERAADRLARETRRIAAVCPRSVGDAPLHAETPRGSSEEGARGR